MDKSLVQGVEHKYRLHDLVLIFAKSKLRCLKTERVVFVTSRQARYLSRLSVLREYAEIEMQGGFYALMGLWASVEELSRDDTLQTTTYGAVLRELEASEATADTAAAYGAVGILFLLQVGFFESVVLPWCFRPSRFRRHMYVGLCMFKIDFIVKTGGSRSWPRILGRSRNTYFRSLHIKRHCVTAR